MNILVCLKQVPDMASDISIGADGRTVVVNEPCEYRTNRFDEFALEAAIAFKEANPGNGASDDNRWHIDLVTVGPERAAGVLKRGVGMGADRGIHILCEDATDISPFQTAGWIAAGLEKRPYHLILTGALSEDLMQGQTGPILAARLGIPAITSVISIHTLENKPCLRVEREREGGEREVLLVKMPALLAVQPGINRPRYPSLSNLLRANRSRPHTLTASDLSAPKPRQIRIRAGYPEQKRAGKVLEGTVQEKASALMTLLKRLSLVKRV